MLWVFDWDGTLMNSTAKIVDAMMLAINELQMPPLEPEAIKSIIGLALPEAIEQLYPDSSDVDIQALIMAYRNAFVALDRQPCQLFPFVSEVLVELRGRGDALAVATSKSRVGLSRGLSALGWEEFFDASRCADETRSKPHPQMLLEIMQELNVSPAAAVMVGDTSYDMEMAHRAAVTPVAVTYGAHSQEGLLRSNPVAVIDDFTQLLSLG